MNPFRPGYNPYGPPPFDPSFAGHHIPPPAPAQHVIPPSVSPMDGVPGMPKYGNDKLTAKFITDMIVGQDHQGVSLNQSGLVPETYTLQFSFVATEKNANGDDFIPTCRAIINWKVDGQQQRRVISIVSGASISAPCNAVDVKLLDVPLGGSDTEGKNYKVQTTLSRGLRANTQEPPTLTDQLVQSVAGGVVPIDFEIPVDSGVTSVFVMAGAGGTGDVFTDNNLLAIFADNHQPSPATYGSFYPLKCCHWVPIPPGSQKVRIFNGAAGVTFFCQCIWGIDG